MGRIFRNGIHIGLTAVLGVIWLGIMLTPVAADTVVLTDGRTFIGVILSETDEKVVIDTMITGIRTKLPLQRSDIESVTKGPVPNDFFTVQPAPKLAAPAKPHPSAPPADKNAPAAAPPAAPSPAEPQQVGQTPYLVVPIIGAFGTDVVPEGVNATLDYAVQHDNIKHIVFLIDSPGGRIYAANKILDSMRAHGNKLQYHALIRNAISASIWVVFASDTIHIVDGAVVGGAVVYSKNVTTGNAEVDAKMNSIVCAEIRAEAERKHHPALLVDAMMIQNATAAAWQDARGLVHIAPTLPEKTPPESIIFQDTDQTILTLSKEQAVRIHLAQPLAGDDQELGAALGLPGWQKYNTYGEWAMEVQAAPYKALHERLNRLKDIYEIIKNNSKEAWANDPRAYHDYSIWSSSGQFTAQSRRQWCLRTDAAVAAWERVKKNIQEVQQIRDESKRLGLLEKNDSDLDIDDTLQRCDREITRLRQDKNRSGI